MLIFRKFSFCFFLLTLLLMSACGGGSGSSNSSTDPDENTDTTPPGEVTVADISAGISNISILWADPGDSDFDHVIVTWSPDGSSGIEIGAGIFACNIDSLDYGTEYTILIRTVDNTGNISNGVSATETTIQPKFISTADDLNAIRGGVAGYEDWGLDDYYIMNAHIDLDAAGYSIGNGWEPLGSYEDPFTGTLDANGYNISNLTIDRDSTQYVGLFGCTNGATIKDLNLLDAEIAGSSDTGGLVGYSKNTLISDCSVTGSVEGTNHRTGGLVGYVDGGIVADSRSEASITGIDSYVGGLAGCNSGMIEHSYSTGNISSTVPDFDISSTGGLVGYNYGSIEHSYSTGDISITVSGFDISAVGGLVGRNYTGGEISNCYAEGNINISINDAGNCFYTGGLAGENYEGVITYCHAAGNISVTITGTGDGYNIGGFTGRDFGDEITTAISKCYATGSIDLPISGDFTYSDTTGGFLGVTYHSIIKDCYALGNVSGDDFVGGFTGRCSHSTIDNCYSTGYVTDDGVDTDLMGGFIGELNSGIISNCFYDSDTSGQADTNGNTRPKTTLEMQDIDTFTDISTPGLSAAWDFTGTENDDSGVDDIWSIDDSAVVNDGYPYLSDLQP